MDGIETPQSESRLSAFAGGQSGTGLNVASSLANPEQVDPDFHPNSVLALPNMIETANGMSQSTYGATAPYAAMMRRHMAGGSDSAPPVPV